MTTRQFSNPVSHILWHFLGFLDRIYGMHTDACSGVEIWGQRIAELTSAKGASPSARLFIGDGAPGRPNARYKHSATIAEIVDRNSRGGQNQLLLSQACIVFVFTVWDTSFRPIYAQALAKDQKEIASDVLGDLRLYRHAILHNNAILEKQTAKLDFVKVGNRVELKRDQMDQLFSLLFEAVSEINLAHTGESLGLNFERPLN